MTATASGPPGLRLRLSQTGLQYAAEVAIDRLASDVQGHVFHDECGDEKVVIGKIKYELTNMNVVSFTRPASSLVVNPDQGITWSLSGAAAKLHGNWRYKLKGLIKTRDDGDFDVKASGVSAQVTITMGIDQDGRPTIATTSCSTGIESVHVKTSGGASWLYNLVVKLLERPIEKKLKELMFDSIKKSIDVNAAKSLSKMKVSFSVGDGLTLDYRLVSPPTFGSGYVQTNHKGEFKWTESGETSDSTPEVMTIPDSAQKMLTICLSDYVMNTFGYLMHRGGFLNYTLTKSDLPEEHKHSLNMRSGSDMCIGVFIPKLAHMYPTGCVELDMKTTAPPNMVTSGEQIICDFRGQVIVNVRFPDDSLKHAFTSQLETKMPMEVTMVDDRLTAQVKDFIFNVNDTQSDVGNIPPQFQEFLLNIAAKRFIIPKMNELGEKGIGIPTLRHVRFDDAELLLLDGALCFSTNVRYDPGS